MKLSRIEIETLLNAGIEIVGDLLKIEDIRNKVTYEIPLADIGQISFRKRYRFSSKRKTKLALVVHKWDTSKVLVDVNADISEDLKSSIKSFNGYFYAES